MFFVGQSGEESNIRFNTCLANSSSVRIFWTHPAPTDLEVQRYVIGKYHEMRALLVATEICTFQA